MTALDLAEGCAGVLETPRLRLRPPIETDAAEIARLLDDADLVRFTSNIPYPYEPAMALGWIAKVAVERLTGRTAAFVIENRSDSRLLGIVAMEIDAERNTGTLGYWLGRAYWRQGFMSEAVASVLARGFADLRLDRIVAEVMPENAASLSVVRRLGLRECGRERRPAPARNREVEIIRHEISRAAWASAHALPVLLVAAVALVDGDGRVLLARRPPGKPMAGLWEFPGGKVQEGESPEAALVRELREELAIDTSQSCLAPLTFASHRYEKFHLLMPLFACRTWRGTPTPIEGQELAWVRPNRMRDYEMPPADLPLIAALRDLL